MADWSNEKARTVREYLFRNASARLDYDRHVVRELREIKPARREGEYVDCRTLDRRNCFTGNGVQ